MNDANQTGLKLDNEAAIIRLVDDHGGLLFSLGLRFCGNRHEAEDLAQEVFLQAYRGWSTFDGRSSVKTWLYTIASRVCQRMHRKRSGEPETMPSLDALLPFGEPLVATIPSDESDPLYIQIRNESREQIESAIASLPQDFRMPLILKEIVGFTVPQVAQILGIEEGTVKSRIHRARLKLRAAIDRTIARREDAPPPAYSKQTCLDLLDAKQEALDRGVAFDTDIICRRCQSVFATLDLASDICRDLGHGEIPTDLRERLLATITK